MSLAEPPRKKNNVMAGLVPAVHVFQSLAGPWSWDARDAPGHDGEPQSRAAAPHMATTVSAAAMKAL